MTPAHRPISRLPLAYGLPPVPPRTAASRRSTRTAPARPLPGCGPRLGGGGIARPRRGLRAMPELPHPARRGQLARYRPGRRDGDRRRRRRQPDLRQLDAPPRARSRRVRTRSRTSRPWPPPATPAIRAPARTTILPRSPALPPPAAPRLTAASGGSNARGFSEGGMVAQRRLRRRFRLRPARRQARLSGRHRLHRPLLRRLSADADPTTRADRLRLGQRWLDGGRRHQPRDPADRRRTTRSPASRQAHRDGPTPTARCSTTR